jgi:hypothetical protein
MVELCEAISIFCIWECLAYPHPISMIRIKTRNLDVLIHSNLKARILSTNLSSSIRNDPSLPSCQLPTSAMDSQAQDTHQPLIPPYTNTLALHTHFTKHTISQYGVRTVLLSTAQHRR